MKRTGYNILAQFLDGQQKQNCLNHLAEYRPAVITVMDDPAFAMNALLAAKEETMVIHRHYHQRDGHCFETMTALDYANHITYNRTLDTRLWVQVENEPDTTPHKLPMLVEWLLAVVDIIEAWGYRAVVGNIGTATVLPETIASGVFDPLLFRAATWQHVMGYHTYTGVLVPFGVGYWNVDDLRDPIQMQPEMWPEINPGIIEALMAQELGRKLDLTPFIDVPPEEDHYWHIYREEWFQARGVQIGAGRHRYVIPEGLLDRMGDISPIYSYLEQTYGATSDVEIKGAPTLEKVWAAWWPQWSFDEALAQQNFWMERNAPDECIGWCWFAWCFDDHIEDKEQKWERGYNIGDRVGFQQLMTANRDVPAKPEEPEEPPIDPPLPDAPGCVVLAMSAIVAAVIVAIIYSIIAPRLTASAMEVIMEPSALEELLNQLFAIPVFATVAYTGGIVYFLTEIWKRFRQNRLNDVKWLEWAQPEVIAPSLIMLFVIAHGIAAEYAYDNLLKEVMVFISELTDVIGPIILTWIGANAVTSYSYDKLQAMKVPGFTYKIRKRVKAE